MSAAAVYALAWLLIAAVLASLAALLAVTVRIIRTAETTKGTPCQTS